MSKTQSDDYARGRGAAERLADSWPDRSWVTDAPNEEWARGAIEAFRDLVRGQRAIFRASQEGSERGAESLSPRPFQGILESIQNADDVGATEVRFVLVRGRPSELLIVHDGAPVDLSHAGAMALPWLTTKTEDAEASGRFGIGQKTLRALGEHIEVHCSPFHFALGKQGPEWAESIEGVDGIYQASARQTLTKVRLSHFLKTSDLMTYLAGLGAGSLLFLRNVRRISVFDGMSGVAVATHSLIVEASGTTDVRIRRQRCAAAWLKLRDPATEMHFQRYLVEAPVSQEERRRHKASSATTTLGIAVPDRSFAGGLYDRLPLPLTSGFPFSLNAQFDPDAARSTIQPFEWNERRFVDLVELAAQAGSDCMRRDPSAAWYAVPLRDEAPGGSDWLATQLRQFVTSTHEQIGRQVTVPTGAAGTPIRDLVYEVGELDGILDAVDQERLAPHKAAVPTSVRDRAGRWRLVLDGLALSTSIDVEAALDIFDLEEDEFGQREPEWFVAMASAAVDADLLEELLWKRSVLLADDRRVEPPGSQEPRTLVTSGTANDLAVALGVAMPIHPGYTGSGLRSAAVLSAFRRAEVLMEASASPGRVFEILSRSGGSDHLEPIRVSSDHLVLLRDGFESLGDERQAEYGPRVGRNIALASFAFNESGGKVEGWMVPGSAYLPAAIDRETASFARAAATTPGLWWLDPRYARILRRSGGRREIGAQRFLVRLGAATQPRLVRPKNERAPWARDPRPASPIDGVERPDVQVREIAALSPRRTYLLEDRWSPDLETVASDIADDRNAKRRRIRGLALLAVLSRSWDRHYADYATAKAVYAYNGFWEQPRDVIATWLARTVETEWLPSASGTARAPVDLALPTEANRMAHGTDRRIFLAAVDDSILRGAAVDALRLRRGPAVSSLIGHLKELASSEVDSSTYDETLHAYQLLALACPRDGRSAPIGDLSLADVRAAFGGARRTQGLLLVNGSWRSPTDVLAGQHVFGLHRPFVPNQASLRPLWKALNIREPTVVDWIAVMRELAKSPLLPVDVGVIIEMSRWLAEHLGEASPQLRAQLARMPLWVGDRWVSSRPIYATEDAALTTEISSQVPTWVHGLTSFVGLEEVLGALRITVVRREDFRPDGVTSHAMVVGSALRPRLSLAVQHLRDELARNDHGLYESVAVDWTRLATAELLVDEALELSTVTTHGARLVVRVDAHLLRDPLALVVRSSDAVGSADAAGRAIAALFSGDRQKVAWAWAAMWQRALAGEDVSGVYLPDDGDEATDGTAALLRLKGQAASRQRGRARTKENSGGDDNSGKRGQILVRPLKDIGLLQPDAGTLVNEGKAKPGIVFPTPTQVSRPDPVEGGSGQPPGGSGTATKSGSDGKGERTVRTEKRSVPAPVDDREQLAFDAVRSALALDPPEIRDLRTRRGVGADAMDDLLQLFEIKMASGELDNEVTLKKSQAEAALDPDFFLAVVSGLDEGDVPLKVRFIFDPLRRLQQRITGDVTLTGIREVEALEYTFGSRGADDPSAAQPEGDSKPDGV